MDFLDLQPKPLISEQLGHQIISMKLQSEAPQSHCDVEQPDSFTYLHSFKGLIAHNFSREFPGIPGIVLLISRFPGIAKWAGNWKHYRILTVALQMLGIRN